MKLMKLQASWSQSLRNGKREAERQKLRSGNRDEIDEMQASWSQSLRNGEREAKRLKVSDRGGGRGILSGASRSNQLLAQRVQEETSEGRNRSEEGGRRPKALGWLLASYPWWLGIGSEQVKDATTPWVELKTHDLPTLQSGHILHKIYNALFFTVSHFLHESELST
jgi:hypothetical protein